MKPTISPEHTARLERIVADLDAFTREMADPRKLDSPFHYGKLSGAGADLHFVLQSTSRQSVEDVLVREEVLR